MIKPITMLISIPNVIDFFKKLCDQVRNRQESTTLDVLFYVFEKVCILYSLGLQVKYQIIPIDQI